MKITKRIFTVLAIILIVLLLSKITIEIRDDYDEKREDPYLLNLVEQLCVIPEVKEIIEKSGLKFFTEKKSYTINKKYVHICIYDKDGNLYPKNQLVLVLLHEIAHAICGEIGHTQLFHSILDKLLEKASKTEPKLYDPSIPHIVNYCTY